MTGLELRLYQSEALDAVRSHVRAGRRKVMLSAPTGSGKTEMAMSMVESAVSKNRRVVFLCDRQALVNQTSRRFDEHEIRHGVSMADAGKGNGSESVRICSVQTLEKRGWPDSDLLVVDEAHSLRKSVVDYVADYEGVVVGLSATPFKSDLGSVYDAVVNAATTDDLMASGSLVRELKVYGDVRRIDMAGVEPTSRGEWSDAQVESQASEITGDVVREWLEKVEDEFGRPVKTLVFSATVEHGRRLCSEFRAAGQDFRQVSYLQRDSNERERNIEDFRAGPCMGLVSCEALVRGFDVPDVRVLVDCRPYRKSLAAHLQKIGRLMRPATGKEYGVLIDHAGNWLRFLRETKEFWASGVDRLGTDRWENVVGTERDEGKPSCQSCGAELREGEDRCWYCGTKLRRNSGGRDEGVVVVPGKLVLLEEPKDEDPKNEDAYLWRNISLMALRRAATFAQGEPSEEALERAAKWAAAQHKNLTGSWRGWGRKLDPCDELDPDVERRVTKAYEAWRRKQGLRPGRRKYAWKRRGAMK